MNDDLTVQEISLDYSPDRNRLIRFLSRHHLNYETDIETAFGIFDREGRLSGCGCAAGSLLKCFAVEESLRGQNALGALISRLVANRFAAGFSDLFVITRPENEVLFSACGFFPLAGTGSVLMLENRRNGPEHFYAPFLSSGHTEQTPEELPNGCIVMNCNPFTRGHLALIEHAAARCGLLYIFVVEENRSFFPFADRIRLVREGTAGFSNVRILPSGPYIISSATFPSYFLKKEEDATQIQCELDIALFASRIAPLFSITRRFAGEEPLDPVTREYNRAMERILPRMGIEFHLIERICAEDDGTGGVISASRVRALLERDGVSRELLKLVPPCTAAYLQKRFGTEQSEKDPTVPDETQKKTKEHV